MEQSTKILLCILIALISSCVGIRPPLQEVPQPPQRIYQNGYSFLPLQESGWLIGRQETETTVLIKSADDPDESMIFRTFTRVLPPLNSDEEFIGFSKSVLVITGTSRHKILSQTAKLLPLKGQPCARTDTIIEDHDAPKRSQRTEHMILEAYSILCKHPNKKTGILLAYSHRYYSGNKDPESANKAQTFFDSLEYSDL